MWYFRYEVFDELGSGVSFIIVVIYMLFGVVIDCGFLKIRENDFLCCNIDLFLCLFEISKGM